MVLMATQYVPAVSTGDGLLIWCRSKWKEEEMEVGRVALLIRAIPIG